MADNKSSSEPQLVDLSSELEEEEATASQEPSSSSEATTSGGTSSANASPAPATSGTEANAGEASTGEAKTGEASSSASASAEPAASDSTQQSASDNNAQDKDSSSDDDSADETEAQDTQSASSEDQEWLFSPPTPASQMKDNLNRGGAPSFAGTMLDSRRSVLESSWNARSFEGTVMDSRAARDLTGRKVEKWTQQKTALDSRAVREVKGRVLTDRDKRLAGSILDARANRSNTMSPLQAKTLVRRFNPQMLLNPTPPTTGRFFVLLGPVPDFAFQECSGLSFSLETEPYSEGGLGWNQQFPSRIQYENLIFTRGLVIGPGWIQLRRWRESMLSDGPPLRMSGVIVMQNDLGVPICFWRFKNGFPVRWTGPTLQPGSTDLAVETLEIAHEGLKVIDIALAGDVISDSAMGMGSVMASASGSSELNSGMGAAQGLMSGDGSGVGQLLGG